MKKRGQVTIFIIVGIILVGIISLFFLIRSGVIPGIGEKPEENPNIFLESCIEDKVKEGIEKISIQGGYIENPLHKKFKLEDENLPVDISYLCYNQNDDLFCVNQEPMLIRHLEDEIKNYISDDVVDCFDKLTSSLINRGYGVDVNYRDFEVELMEKKVVIEIDAELILTKADETSTQEDFKIIIPSRFYDLALVVQEIINKEATICDFNNYDMLHYPELNINKYRTMDSSIIYNIEHRESGEEFRFAVRGCVTGPGFGFEFS